MTAGLQKETGLIIGNKTSIQATGLQPASSKHE